jgi:hypothetical protein
MKTQEDQNKMTYGISKRLTQRGYLEAGLSYDCEFAAPEHPPKLFSQACFGGLQLVWTLNFHSLPSMQFPKNSLSQLIQIEQRLLQPIDLLRQPMAYRMLLMAPDLTGEPELQLEISGLMQLDLFY